MHNSLLFYTNKQTLKVAYNFSHDVHKCSVVLNKQRLYRVVEMAQGSDFISGFVQYKNPYKANNFGEIHNDVPSLMQQSCISVTADNSALNINAPAGLLDIYRFLGVKDMTVQTLKNRKIC